jgi:cell wall-associated NlpC family hydrolase
MSLPSKTAASAVARFLACAEAQVGKPYQWASAGPNAFDCSGLVAYCYQLATGEAISRDSHAQFTLGERVSGPPTPGDLLFFDTGFSRRLDNRASHVGIAQGNGVMIHAFNEDAGVVRSDLSARYWQLRQLGVRRLFSRFSAPVASPPAAPDPPRRPRRTRQRRRR